MESTGMVHKYQTLILLKSAQDFSSVYGYTMTDLFYQQPSDFSMFSSAFFLTALIF